MKIDVFISSNQTEFAEERKFQLNEIYMTGFTKKWVMEFLEKVTAYPNEAMHECCVVTFTGRYEKLATEKQPQRIDVDKWYST